MANKKQSRAREELIRFLTRHEGMRFKHRGKDWLSMTRLYPILKQEEKRRTWLQMELYEFGSRKLRELMSSIFFRKWEEKSSAENEEELQIFKV